MVFVGSPIQCEYTIMARFECSRSPSVSCRHWCMCSRHLLFINLRLNLLSLSASPPHHHQPYLLFLLLVHLHLLVHLPFSALLTCPLPPPFQPTITLYLILTSPTPSHTQILGAALHVSLALWHRPLSHLHALFCLLPSPYLSCSSSSFCPFSLFGSGGAGRLCVMTKAHVFSYSMMSAILPPVCESLPRIMFSIVFHGSFL